jgi:hypothetical protein
MILFQNDSKTPPGHWMTLPFQELGTWIPDALFALPQNHCCLWRRAVAADGPSNVFCFSLGCCALIN